MPTGSPCKIGERSPWRRSPERVSACQHRGVEPVIINSRRWSIFWRALFGVAFTAGCVYALRQGIKYTHIISLVLGILGIPAFGLLTIGWIRLLGRTALVIDDRGVWDNTSMISVGFIPWEQTLAFLPAQMRFTNVSHDYVFILFADSTWPWRHLRPIRRYYCWLISKIEGFPPAPLTMDTMPLSPVECACLLAEQRRLRRPDLPPAVGPVPDPSSNERFTVLEVDSRVDMAEALDCLYREYLEQSRRAGLIPLADAPEEDAPPDGGADGRQR